MTGIGRAKFMRDWFLYGSLEVARFMAADRRHLCTGVDW